MSVKAKIEAIIYATEEPVTLNQLASLLKDATLAEMRAEEAARLALNEVVAVPAPPDEEELEEELPDFDEPEEPAAEAAPAEEPAAAEASEAPAIADEPVELVDPKAAEKEELKRVKEHLSTLLEELIADYAADSHGVEIRQIAGGYRMATKPEHHDVVIGFAKSLKPPIRLSMQALETLSVIAYKQPVTVPEISEVRGVDSAGVIATLLDRKLVTTAGRKQVIGRPILYKTTKEFLLRFGLNDISELPSMEEFEKLGDPQAELFQAPETQPAEGAAAAAASEAEAGAEGSEADSEGAAVTEADPAMAASEAPSEAPADTPAVEGETVTEADPALASEGHAEAPAEALDAEDAPVTEADSALVSAENQNELPADANEPARFDEAVAPVPGVGTLDESTKS